MKRIVSIIVVCFVGLGIASALIWGFRSGRAALAADAESDSATEAPSRVATEGGKDVLVFDQQAQRTNGIAVTKLAGDRRSAETQANGVILQLQPLLDQKASYDTALMNIAKARAAARASQAEYNRLLRLNRGEENVSQRAVEMARAASESDAAVLENAQQFLIVLDGSTKLHWGAVVAGWLKQPSPQLEALLEQREFLLQVTAVNAGGPTAPPQATVELPDGRHVFAHLISALPQLDSRLQAPGYLYAVPAQPGLAPGINLAVYLPAGPVRSGVVVPYSAVVWWQGRAWCYVEQSPGRFTRKQVATENPTPGGWFVNKDIAGGAGVVTAGPQTLLSEEFRSQIPADEN